MGEADSKNNHHQQIFIFFGVRFLKAGLSRFTDFERRTKFHLLCKPVDCLIVDDSGKLANSTFDGRFTL